jgi:hypothetical protein
MPQAVQAKQELLVNETESSSSFNFSIRPDVLPEHLPRVTVFDGDDIDALFPGDERQGLRDICKQLFPAEGCRLIDHIQMGREKGCTKLHVQPVVGETPIKIRGRVDAALRACGFIPKYGIQS